MRQRVLRVAAPCRTRLFTRQWRVSAADQTPEHRSRRQPRLSPRAGVRSASSHGGRGLLHCDRLPSHRIAPVAPGDGFSRRISSERAPTIRACARASKVFRNQVEGCRGSGGMRRNSRSFRSPTSAGAKGSINTCGTPLRARMRSTRRTQRRSGCKRRASSLGKKRLPYFAMGDRHQPAHYSRLPGWRKSAACGRPRRRKARTIFNRRLTGGEKTMQDHRVNRNTGAQRRPWNRRS
jgi:hypothetical protein